jgi:HindIII restriction endonuclease.
MFLKLIEKIQDFARYDFEYASSAIIDYVNNDNDFIESLKQIAMIPESIDHDSTEEKLFSKASDAILARAFREIGLKSTVLKERGDSADVIAKSPIYGYTLVADAKAFRMSRTAKNQKDFKISALSGWRKENDYAVLCSPYFQYPKNASQIYAQAIDHNVCLLSWEQLIFLIENKIKESTDLDFSLLWNFCDSYAHRVSAADRKRCFLDKFNNTFLDVINRDNKHYHLFLNNQISTIKNRGDYEKKYWSAKIEEINNYSKEQAIIELIKSKKIIERLKQIDVFIRGLRV